MKNGKLFFVFSLFVLACFVTCSVENPIMEKWWQEGEEDYEYVVITKLVPDEQEVIRIVENLPGVSSVSSIDIINIEFIIFAGNSTVYNGPPGPGGNTPLTSQEKNTNNINVNSMAKALADSYADTDPGNDLYIILHGHANPDNPNNPNEVAELQYISITRAAAVATVLKEKFIPLNPNVTFLEDHLSTNGYGGGHNLFGNNTSYANLNRRVELILFKITP